MASTAWATGDEEKMTLRADNSILFYMNCSNYCSATGSNGLRFGKAAGDYMLFPAIPGKSLKKVAVTFLTDDNMKAAIRTRSGCSDVLGGGAVGKQLANTTYEYNLVGTARNMQYRYELPGANDATHISKIVLTYASKGTPAGEEPEVPALVVTADFVDADEILAENVYFSSGANMDGGDVFIGDMRVSGDVTGFRTISADKLNGTTYTTSGRVITDRADVTRSVNVSGEILYLTSKIRWLILFKYSSIKLSFACL